MPGQHFCHSLLEDGHALGALSAPAGSAGGVICPSDISHKFQGQKESLQSASLTPDTTRSVICAPSPGLSLEI